ncbi:hypothetical protein PR202_ga19190 [Eleusine coracana subsp. coracana]|uniref:Uncharacterized protein n=1 Tax=Eleusine coracana subsp. coracana TaxID=191504 RepID=A0AAV5CTL0_ELECO|nr:hypothetical protein PR202_ga19190 [Eleusine coracana subsp. coracana]
MNNQAKQEDIKQVVNIYKPDIDSGVIRNSLGNDYDDNFQYLPAAVLLPIIQKKIRQHVQRHLALYHREISQCVLWNPAVADGEKEVTVPYVAKSYGYERPLRGGINGLGEYSILGLGYDRTSNTYKLVLTLRHKLHMTLDSFSSQSTYSIALTLLAWRNATLILRHSSRKINIPGGSVDYYENRVVSNLMQMSGRPCLVKNDDGQPWSRQGVVGEIEQDKMEVPKPVNEQDKRKGQKATLDIVSFMEFLIRIMQKLPETKCSM